VERGRRAGKREADERNKRGRRAGKREESTANNSKVQKQQGGKDSTSKDARVMTNARTEDK
jgi:hypothetical protein